MISEEPAAPTTTKPQPVEQDIIRRQHDRLTPARLLSLRVGLVNLAQALSGPMVLGTACSGVDIIFRVMSDTFAEWKARFGVGLDIDHAFACESEPFKQQLLKDMWDIRNIFPDVHLLKNDMIQDIEGNDVRLALSHILAVGVECDSISNLNSERSQNFDCVGEDGSSTKTGQTGRATMETIEEYLPPIFLVENVKNLTVAGKSGKSNMTLIIESANTCGYYVLNFAMKAESFGCPQHRERRYVIGVLVSTKPVNQLHDDFQHPDWAYSMGLMIMEMQLEPMPLKKFLLPSDCCDVLQMRSPKDSDASGQPGAPPKKKQKRKAKETAVEVDSKVPEYQVQHLGAFTEMNLHWPPKYDEEFLDKTGRLTDRQREVLFYEEMTKGQTSTLNTLFSKDLQLSIDWGSDRHDVLPCIVSTSLMWVRGPLSNSPSSEFPDFIDRLLTGSELLNIQGLPYQIQNKSTVVLSNAQKSDLAGNAFCGAVISPILAALVAYAPLPAAFKMRMEIFADRKKAGDENWAKMPKEEDLGSGDESDLGEEGGESESLQEDNVFGDDDLEF